MSAYQYNHQMFCSVNVNHLLLLFYLCQTSTDINLSLWHLTMVIGHRSSTQVQHTIQQLLLHLLLIRQIKLHKLLILFIVYLPVLPNCGVCIQALFGSEHFICYVNLVIRAVMCPDLFVDSGAI